MSMRQKAILTGAIEIAFWRIDIILNQGGADILEAKTEAGEGGSVDADAHGGVLIAFDGDEAYAADFAEFLGQDGVGEVVDLLERKSIGGDGQGQDGCVSRVDLTVSGRIGHFGQNAVGSVHGCLNILGCSVDVTVEIELEGNAGVAEGTNGCHEGQATDLAELPLQRSCYGRSHDIGACARVLSGDLDSGEIDRRQGGDREQ